jgi:hypothetical protein
MKRVLLVLGVLLVAAAGVWKFGLSQQWTNRFSDQWFWEVHTIGLTGYPDEATGQFAEGTTLADDPINVTIRTVTADANGAAGQMVINDHFETRDTATNEVTWDYTSTAVVDAETGRHIEGEAVSSYYFFPRGVDRNAIYVITNSSYHRLSMSFQREEEIAGINTYLFAYYGDLDNTAANAEWVTLEPGQEVVCFDFSLEYWVEPVTGEIVKYREWCEGDWVVDSATGERLYAVSRWGGETSGDDIIRQVTMVQSRRMVYLWASLYAPLGALAAGAVFVGAGVAPLAMRRPQEA